MRFNSVLITAFIHILYIERCLGQDGSCTGRPTMLEVIAEDPQATFALRWASAQSSTGYPNLLGNQGINVTFFLPIDSAVPVGLFRWLGVAGLNISNGITDAHRLASIYLFIDEKLSVDQLLSVPNFNTVLGIIKKEDFLLKITNNDAGDVFVEGLGPNNVGRILGRIDACNGVIYKMDTMVLPANTSTDLIRGPTDAAITLPFWVDNSACPLTVPQVVDDYASDWVGLLGLTGLQDRISDENLSATIFASVDEGLADAADGAKSSNAILYNMLVGQWCPEELKSMGTMNSMLGNVTGENLPLQFSDDNGTLVINGEFGSARVLNIINSACQSLIFITDVPLAAPKRASPAVVPAVLPSLPNRHLTCIQPEYLRASTSSSSSTSSDIPSDDSSSSNVGLIVGVTVGAVCAAALAGSLLYARHRRRTTNGSTSKFAGDRLDSAESASKQGSLNLAGSQSSGREVPSGTTTTDDSPVDGNVIPGSTVPMTPQTNSAKSPGVRSQSSGGAFTPKSTTSSSLDLWELKPADIEFSRGPNGQPIQLGRGSFGAVYAGSVRGVQPAAIKVLEANVGMDAEIAFQQEAAIMKHVNRDRNIVQLYGTAQLPDGKLLLVTELMESGDLRRALTNMATSDALQWHRGGKRVALDVARGLTALHAVNVIHRDLKSKNVLLTDTMTAKIADVGIAAVHSQGYLTASAGQVIGTLAWSAPELLLGERCTEKVDIYSLGILLWELATSAVPVRGCTQPPPPSERCPAELAALINDCTSTNPDDRPTAKEVYDRILTIPPVYSV